MDKSNLDKLIRLYREGYISRDELIIRSKKAILKKDKSAGPHNNRPSTRPTPATKRSVSAPMQAIIDLDTPPKIPDRIAAASSANNVTLWNGKSPGNPILASMVGGALIAMAILAIVIVTVDSDNPPSADNQPQTNNTAMAGDKTSKEPSATPTVAATENGSVAPVTENRTLKKLQDIANEFEQSNHWPQKKIAQFQQLWQSLPDSQQNSVKNTHWFKTFSLILAIQVTQIHSMSLENPENSALQSEQETLLKLSTLLGNSVADFEDPVIKAHTNIRISDIDIQTLPTPSEAATSADKNVTRPMPSTATTTSITANMSRLPELEKLLSEYVGYYENGNLDNIVKLFHGSGWHKKGQIGDFELRESYKETFNQTLQRKMLIENLSWSFKGSTALATGKLTLLYTDRENQERHEQHGSIRLVAKLHDNQFRFSNLYHILQ